MVKGGEAAVHGYVYLLDYRIVQQKHSQCLHIDLSEQLAMNRLMCENTVTLSQDVGAVEDANEKKRI